MDHLKPHKSVEQIAKKHRMDVSDIQKQLDMGEPIEHEHTKDHKLAMDIALQHLDEIPDYYTRLKKMEADAKKEHKKFKDVKEDAVVDLQKGLTELEDASYDSVDSLMRRIMKKRGMSAKQLHNKFVSRNNKTPDSWIKDQKMKEEMEIQKFCKLCRKVETRNECSYGPEMWDKYTRPQEILSQNQVKYNTNRPHPANENVTIEDANGNTFIEIIDLIKPEPLVKEESKSGDQGLHDWFGKSKSSDGKKGWVQLGGKFSGKPCARQPGQTSTPKCGSSKMKRTLSKDEEETARRRKNRLDSNQPEKTGGAKPTNVRTEEVDLQEVKDKSGKNSGKKDACYNKVKSRYDVWPSAYASGALVKCRKVGADSWGTKSEDCWDGYTQKGMKKKGKKMVPNCVPKEGKSFDEFMSEASPAWQRKEGKNSEGGLNKKGIASYRKENPGSNLSLAVTTKPSELKKGSKSANRRKSFCSRMSGMKKKLTSAKTANDPNSRINKSLRKWNC